MIQLFAVTPSDLVPLPVPPTARSFDDLYHALPLGVYSAFRTFDKNKFLGLADHLARNRQSMALLGWAYELDETRLRQALHEVATHFPAPNARLRFDVLAEPIEVAGEPTRLLVAAMPFAGITPTLYTDGVAVGVATALHRENPLVKTAVFVQQRNAQPVGGKDIYERLLLDAQGNILECTSANFYGVLDGTLYTAEEGILEGITRRIILALVDQLGIPLRREPVPLSAVPRLSEAGLSSSSRGLIPIVRIENAVVGNGRPGPIMTRLHQAYEQYVAGAVETAV